MVTHERNGTFANVSQRVAYSYIRSLTDFTAAMPEGFGSPEQCGLEASQQDLHAFINRLYTALFEAPEQFGLPLTEDACITGSEENPVQFKQEVTKKLNKPRALVEQGLDFLMLVGQRGWLADGVLALERETYAALINESKVKKPFLKGLVGVGLTVMESEEMVMVSSPAYPNMMPALKSLSEACARYEDQRMGKFNFARCDFRALDGCFTPGALDLYPVFDPIDRERVERLHIFVLDLQYKMISQVGGVHGWEVQYQPRPKVKTSPLLRIEYSERYKNSLQVDVKCASTSRIIPLVYQQPRFLQEDFARRVISCNGSACNWCKDKKGLGPSEFEFDGVQKTICWYHNPDVDELNEKTLQLLQQYALMHEELG